MGDWKAGEIKVYAGRRATLAVWRQSENMPSYLYKFVFNGFSVVAKAVFLYPFGPNVAQLENLLERGDEFFDIFRRRFKVEEVVVHNCFS